MSQVNISPELINDLEVETLGISHGIVTLQMHIRDFNLTHYKIIREKSVILESNKNSKK